MCIYIYIYVYTPIIIVTVNLSYYSILYCIKLILLGPRKLRRALGGLEVSEVRGPSGYDHAEMLTTSVGVLGRDAMNCRVVPTQRPKASRQTLRDI